MHRLGTLLWRVATSSGRAAGRGNPLPVTDGAAALVLAAVALASAALEPAETVAGVTRPFDRTAAWLILAMTLPLAWRRGAPRTVALLTTATAVASVLAGHPVGIGPFGAVFALHSLAHTTTDRITTSIGLPCGIALLVGQIMGPGTLNVGNVAGNGLFILFALVAGALLRRHDEQRAALARKNIELTAAREAQVRAAVNDERLRIAREVHDAVGHALVAITLQARVGQRRVTKDPGRAHEALTEIESLAQHALDDTRSAVVRIRGDHQPSSDSVRLTADSLQALIDTMRGPDLRVTLDIDIGHITMGDELDRTAFRIIQESLSNVAKHATPSQAVVSVTSDGRTLAVEVVNTGTTGPPSGVGSGIRGMRERAERLGGTLGAGPTPDGWRVHARLPLHHVRTAALA